MGNGAKHLTKNKREARRNNPRNVAHLLWDQSWIQIYTKISLRGDTQSVKTRKVVEDGRKFDNGQDNFQLF